MVEVFKTDVREQGQANMLLDLIHRTFMGYSANFDLEDCDRILRVKCSSGHIQPAGVIDLLKEFGVKAEVLPE